MTIERFIKLFRPCQPARKYLKGFDNLSDAWEECENGEWLDYVIWQMTYKNKITSRFPDYRGYKLIEHLAYIFEEEESDTYTLPSDTWANEIKKIIPTLPEELLNYE